jgi:nucleoside 2-deoxyribosyltransferase
MKCFVIMPFAKDFDDVYATVQRAVGTVREGKAQCLRLDEVKAAGRITDDLVRELNESAICVADLTGCNPNVMWEVGYAMALRKPVIFISQDVASLPFDLRVMRTIAYRRHSLGDSLERELAESFRETLGAFVLEREDATRPLPQASVLSIAVTGSMEANRSRCLRRLETLLEPYLGRGVTWYCGSYGDVDVVTCEFLVTRNEKVVVVGYDAYDISEQMLALVKAKAVPFVDAGREQLPKGFRGPTDRDVLFFTKADVIILLWNGQSPGTLEMIDWYRSNEKDHIVGFVGEKR